MMESGTVGTDAETTNSAEATNGKTAGPELLDGRNPATGETIATLPVDPPEAVAATVARVRAAQPDWEAMGIDGRYHWLGKLRDWGLDNSHTIASTMPGGIGEGG